MKKYMVFATLILVLAILVAGCSNGANIPAQEGETDTVLQNAQTDDIAAKTQEAAPEPTPEPTPEATYSNSTEYEGIKLSVQQAGFFEEQAGKYFFTAGGSFNYENGSSLWAGSTLGVDSIVAAKEYKGGMIVAFTCDSSLEAEALAEKLEPFAEKLALDDGSNTLMPARRLYADGVVALLYETKKLVGKNVALRMDGGGGTVIAEGEAPAEKGDAVGATEDETAQASGRAASNDSLIAAAKAYLDEYGSEIMGAEENRAQMRMTGIEKDGEDYKISWQMSEELSGNVTFAFSKMHFFDPADLSNRYEPYTLEDGKLNYQFKDGDEISFKTFRMNFHPESQIVFLYFEGVLVSMGAPAELETEPLYFTFVLGDEPALVEEQPRKANGLFDDYMG